MFLGSCTAFHPLVGCWVLFLLRAVMAMVNLELKLLVLLAVAKNQTYSTHHSRVPGPVDCTAAVSSEVSFNNKLKNFSK